ncbi:hypothetical protein BDZ97DRAFT_1912268 [Flammula alnicola]|nr:hypothetical protein BDZ97DRAFT_1912268 [Flammula alnicola]
MPVEILGSPKKSVNSPEKGPPFHTILLHPRTSSGSEVIPDSEEERQQQDVYEPRKVIEVIEISSDESDEDHARINQNQDRSQRVRTQNPSKRQPFYSRSRIIESSDEDSGVEIIELSDSSVDVAVIRTKATGLKTPTRGRRESPPPSPSRAGVDESIIIFDDPRNSRTPLRVESKKKNDRNPSNVPDNQAPSTPKKNRSLATQALINNTAGLSDNTVTTSTPPSQRLTGKAAAGTPRSNSKKAQLAAELQKRHEYAQRVFTDLNKSVFRQGLPEDTKLNWNKRLLTTAGKLNSIGTSSKDNQFMQNGRLYLRSSREGVQTTEIELAEKILDCEVCGACKEGKLIPLFTSKRKPATPKLSRMAAAKPQDSPRSKQDASSSAKNYVEGLDSDSEDSVIEILTKSLASTSIIPY